MSTKVEKKKEFMELTPEEMAEIEKESKNVVKSSYMMDFTTKKMDKPKGFGKINAFMDSANFISVTAIFSKKPRISLTVHRSILYFALFRQR